MLHPSQITSKDLGDPNWWRYKSRSLAWFNANVMPHGWTDKFHDFGYMHHLICDHLDPTINTNTRKYLSAFRGSHKTTQLHGFMVWFFCWNLAKKVSNSLVYNTATKDNAFNMQADIKQSLLHNDVLQWMFPELPKDEMNYDSMTKNRIEHHNVRLDFTSLETTLVSRHYPIWINDDLENDENCRTDFQREELKRKWRYQKAILTRISKRNIGLEIEVGTPYNKNGLTWMIRNMERYSKLEIPCYINGDKKQGVWFPELYAVKDFEEKLEDLGTTIFCTPEETPILMADWSVKPIKDVKIGDEVIGFEIGIGKKGKYVKTMVKDKYQGKDYVYNITTESGNTVKCTKEHKWFSGRLEELRGDKKNPHKLYQKIKKNSRLIKIFDIKEEKNPKKLRAWAYLGGIVDGEGACKSGNCIFIHQSEIANKNVFEKIRNTLNYLGIDYKIHQRTRNDSHLAPDGHKINTYDSSCFCLRGGRKLKFDLIRYSDLAKKDQLIKTLWKNNGFSNNKDKATWLKRGKCQDVYGLETGTGNYIAWGYLSSNSAQMLLQPLAEEDALCPEHWVRHWKQTPDCRWRSMVIDPGGYGLKSGPGLSDATGITIVDTDENATIYMIYADEHFLTPTKLLETIINLKRSYDPDDMRIEKEKFSTTIADIWEHKYPELNISYVQHAGRSKGDKENQFNTRIWRLKQWFETKRILLAPEMVSGHPFYDQLISFPDTTTRRVDMLDSLAYQLDIRRIPKRKGKIILPSGKELNPSIDPSFEEEFDKAMKTKREREEARFDDANF